MGMIPDDGSLTYKLVQGDIWVPASDLVAQTGSAALEKVDAIHNGLLFDGTSSETAGIGLVMPTHWSKVKLTWYSYNPTSGDGGVVLGAYLEDLANGSSLTAETPTIVAAVTITCDGSEDEDDLVITEGSTEYTVTPGGYTALLVGRLPAASGDTLAADYGLLGVRITPTVLAAV